MSLKDQLYEQKLAYNASHQVVISTLADLHKNHGRLLAERQCREELKRLDKEREKIQAERIIVEEQSVEEIWNEE